MSNVLADVSLSERAWTLEEWAALPEDEPGELVDGRLVEEEVPDYLHEVIVVWLGALFRAWVVPSGGFVGGSEAKFALSPRRGRKPDLSVFLPGRRPPARGPVRVPPDIAVEVVSPTPRDRRRDRVEKLREYATFGVRWYWLLDPEVRSFEVLELHAQGGHVIAVSASEGIVVDIPGCPELTVNLDALWREVDALLAEPQPE